MKFLLQNCRTAEFMRCDSTWSADINEALDFLSERRAFFYGLKELGDSYTIIKIVAETLLPILVPQLILPKSPCGRPARPVRAAGRLGERILPLPSPLLLGRQTSGVFTLNNTLNKDVSNIPTSRINVSNSC